jgi:hypothetical protein
MPGALRLPLPLEHFADLAVQVGQPIEIGTTAQGRHRVIPITGGWAQGQGWRARVLPGGADDQRIVGDTRTELEARYVLELDGGDRIYVCNRGLRTAPASVTAALARGEPVDSSQVYFRCVPSLETTSPTLQWINDRLFAGAGQRHPAHVALSFYVLA